MGFFRAGDISLQFFHSSSKYCLLSLREASRPTPQFFATSNITQSRQQSSSSYYQFGNRLTSHYQTSTIHEDDEEEKETEPKRKKKRKKNDAKVRKIIIGRQYLWIIEIRANKDKKQRMDQLHLIQVLMLK